MSDSTGSEHADSAAPRSREYGSETLARVAAAIDMEPSPSSSSPDPPGSEPTSPSAAPAAEAVAADATTGAASLTIPGYDILGELGRGGQAVVYQAVQRSTKRNVAIKVLLEGAHASRSARHRFEREVELAASLKHPHIISVFDSGVTADGQQFYVMDYVRGVPITQYVRDRKLSVEEALHLFAQACDAVNHAHQRGVIHRDLKPSNILVDDSGDLRILDFGLAKQVASTERTLLSVNGQIMGTVPYMSPEQTRGNPELIDVRTDVYALGVILYEILTGQFPYPVVGEMADVLRHIAETMPRSLTRSWTAQSGIGSASASGAGRRARRCPINDEVETIALKALAKERERRYQSAGELARDVRHYLLGEPIEAKRDSAGYVLKKAMARHRVAVTVGAMVIVLLVAAVVGTSVSRNRAIRAESEAVRARDGEGQLRQLAESRLEQVAHAMRRAEDEKRKAEERLASGLVLEGDGYLRTLRPAQARMAYLEAIALARQLKLSDVPAQAAWFESCQAGIPLMGSDGARAGVAGFAGPRDRITSLAMLPDGRTCLSGGEDGVLRLWDVATGREVRSIAAPRPEARDSILDAVVLADGLSALVCRRTSLTILELATGKEIRKLEWRRGFPTRAERVALLPDGLRALSGIGGPLTVWNLERGTQVRQVNLNSKDLDYSARCMAVSPDCRTLLMGGSGTRTVGDTWRSPGGTSSGLAESYAILKAFDFETGVVRFALDGHRDEVTCAAFAPDGLTAMSGDKGGTLKLWDLATGREIRSFDGHRREVTCVAMFQEGKLALSGSLDGTLRLWDVSTGAEVRCLAGRESGICALAVSPDGRTAISGTWDGALTLWDVRRGPESRRSAEHQHHIKSVATSPDGLTVMSGSVDSTLMWWDLATGQEIGRFSGHRAPIASVAVSPAGRTALSGSWDGTLRLWDLVKRTELHRFVGHGGFVLNVAISPDERIGVSGSADWTLKTWDLASGEQIRTFEGNTRDVTSVAFSPDGTTVMSGSENGELILWNASTGKAVRKFPGHHYVRVAAIAFSPNGRMVLSGAFDRTLKLWDTASGTEIRTLVGHQEPVTSAAIFPDGRTALSASFDRTLKLWDLSTGKELRTLRGHQDFITSAVILPDGRGVVSGGFDKRLLTWDFAQADRYAELERGVREAREVLDKNPGDAKALSAFGQWWAFRRFDAWAADFFVKARAAGGHTSPLALARCYWRTGRLDEARREFESAIQLKEAPETYLRQCIEAIANRATTASGPAGKP